ncbi:rab3 GTPase-activating protein catalytic subunit isoform X2 [Macrosteles quadrilineatus]|uniref:rab3 GTPase-activating protein catalytic subunit isoform X2 n=1 Tax=Macrosteles quadrilineatus TaxID=74068 RepID=UPI0023E176A3|nr:rab3 GTPase-activating protein catalytic subunit isoform X2 [Macrosteles quadrilineatus]
MLNEDIDEQDSYHYDFTTASEWEIFIARLEEIIHDWKVSHIPLKPALQHKQLFNSSWETKTETLSFADVDFTLTRYYAKLSEEEGANNMLDNESEMSKLQPLEDMMSTENDFVPIVFEGNKSHPHLLTRWYGLRDFIVLTPNQSVVITSESKIKILLSSVCIAVNNSNCSVPVFIQVLEPWQNFFLGVCEAKGIRAEYEMVHLRRVPPHCKHLTGLLNVFKSKLGSPSLSESVTVSARLSYILRDWTSFAWTQEPPDLEFLMGEVGVGELGTLPFGATFDPVSELVLYASWYGLRETVVVDSESYSDLDPSQAPQWSVAVKMADKPLCLLSEYLSEFLHLCSSPRSMSDLLGDLLQHQQPGPTLATPLNLLTESRVPTISKVLGQAKGSFVKEKIREGPISDDLLMPILYFLFPDADENVRSPYPEYLTNFLVKDSKPNQEMFAGMKTAPVDSLVWRLSVVMSHATHTLGGVKAAAHLWFEFCQELRFRWERAVPIPGVVRVFPDAKTCLLNQKLQMLNCCVETKTKRENSALASNDDDATDESEDEEEEFFDCDAETEEFTVAGDVVSQPRRKPKHSLWNKPVGRLKRCDNLRLLQTGEPLYIPITQDPVPKTEDQLEEDERVMLQLGADAQGMELRTRMMSASLLSDMESFKAANPGAELEDFIRWYSPRDWIEEDGLDDFGQKKGQLSPRMKLPGNMWIEVWSAAKPVPARRQKRLFDDTREAEKVLHWLEAKQPREVAALLVSPLTHAALATLAHHAAPVEVPGLDVAVSHLASKAELLSRAGTPDMRRYQDLAQEVAWAECVVAQVASLEHKLCPGAGQTCEMRQFLAALVTAPEAPVPGGPRGEIAARIRTMFSEAHKASQMISDSDPASRITTEPWSPVSTSVFPPASEREFILRVVAPRPSPSSLPLSQRLAVRLRKDDIIMAGCFAQDTTFQ